MRQRLMTILAVMAVALSASAQVLWRIDAKDAPAPSYLLGTMHSVEASFLDSIPGFDKALSAVDVVIGEVAQSEMMSGMNALMRVAAAPSDSTLSIVLSDKTRQRLDAILRDQSMGMIRVSQLDRFKPVMVTSQLEMLVAMKANGQLSSEFMEGGIERRATEHSLKILSLETVDQQVSILFSQSIADQAKDLTAIVERWGEYVDHARDLCVAYRRHNLDAIGESVTDTTFSSVNHDTFIFDRNRHWMNRLTPLIGNRATLIYVGAGHLVGDQGLIALMRQAGFSVTPVE